MQLHPYCLPHHKCSLLEDSWQLELDLVVEDSWQLELPEASWQLELEEASWQLELDLVVVGVVVVDSYRHIRSHSFQQSNHTTHTLRMRVQPTFS
jgi:hypothetical protein